MEQNQERTLIREDIVKEDGRKLYYYSFTESGEYGSSEIERDEPAKGVESATQTGDTDV